jgi:hypothetical protein
MSRKDAKLYYNLASLSGSQDAKLCGLPVALQQIGARTT